MEDAFGRDCNIFGLKQLFDIYISFWIDVKKLIQKDIFLMATQRKLTLERKSFIDSLLNQYQS